MINCGNDAGDINCSFTKTAFGELVTTRNTSVCVGRTIIVNLPSIVSISVSYGDEFQKTTMLSASTASSSFNPPSVLI